MYTLEWHDGEMSHEVTSAKRETIYYVYHYVVRPHVIGAGALKYTAVHCYLSGVEMDPLHGYMKPLGEHRPQIIP
jgi:hypothetical protein